MLLSSANFNSNPNPNPNPTPNPTHTPKPNLNPSTSLSTIAHAQLDTQSCALLGPFSILIQALMALIILTSLLYKRHREKPKRKYSIWAADVSKQVIGQAFVHMLNIFISDSMASLPSKGNPCALYFMNIFIDTTIGVFVLFLALNLITTLVSKILSRSPASLGLLSGNYPRPFLTSWLKQLSIYFVGLLTLKLFVIGLFWLGGEALVKFGDGVIEGISRDPKIQILMVVMVGPTILNVLQFLLIDSFIKHKPNYNPDQVESEDGRRFLNDGSDPESDDQNLEDDDDHDHARNSNGFPGHGDEDRQVRKKKDYQTRHSARHQQARLSNPTNLHGSLSANVHDPHSYPPRIPQPETRERNLPPIDLTCALQNRRRTPVSTQSAESSPVIFPLTIPKSHGSYPTTSPAFFQELEQFEISTSSKNPYDPQIAAGGVDHPDSHGHSPIIVQIHDHPTHSTSPTHLKTGFSLLNLDPSPSSQPLFNELNHAVY